MMSKELFSIDFKKFRQKFSLRLRAENCSFTKKLLMHIL